MRSAGILRNRRHTPVKNPWEVSTLQPLFAPLTVFFLDNWNFSALSEDYSGWEWKEKPIRND